MNVQTNTGDGKVLINFRVPVSLKKSFDKVCRYTSLNRSSVLLNFMTNYVQNQGNEIHNQIKDQMPLPKKGVVDAYKSIIPAIFKQAKDKNYFIKVEIPNTN